MVHRTTTAATTTAAGIGTRADRDAAEGADLLVIFTEWNQFRKLYLDRLKALLAAPRILDCRNVYDPQQMRAAGFEYLCVGW